MKGIIIYENDLRRIDVVKLKKASFCCKAIEDDITDTLQGTPVICASTKCSPEDTYDFETGALIALMKMCGREKVIKACDELYKDDNYKNALQEMTENCEKLMEEKEKLQHEYDLCKNSENALKCSVDYLNKTIAKLNTAIYGYKEDLNKVTKRCRELEAKEDILNKQEETINKREEHLSVYFGGRDCGKQYKALVALFKKIDQKKVDAAYKEAYNTKLPVWQKEVLRQACNIVTDEKEKRNNKESLNWCTSQSSTRDYLDSLIEGSRAFTRNFDNEWYYRIPTKRDEMWENILKEGRTPVYVKREDIHDFLEECQVRGIKWSTGKMPLETMPFHMSKGYDGIYFFVMTSLDITKSTSGTKEFRHVMCWWMTASDEEARNSIKYLPPMRWDLFKKGRIVVKVDYDNYEDFYNKCEKELGRKPRDIYTGTFTVYYKYEKELEQYIFHTRPYSDTIPYAKKIVDWEDVR